MEEEEKKTAQKFKYLVVGLVVFALLVTGGLLYYFQTKVVTLKSADSANLATVSIPHNWLAEEKADSNSAFLLYPSASEKKTAESDKAVQNWFGKKARTVSIFIFPAKSAVSKKDIKFFDSRFQSTLGFQKFIVENNSIEGGQYRCAQSPKDSRIEVDCFATFDSKASAYFSLNTDQSNLDDDLARLYKMIESLKVSQ